MQCHPKLYLDNWERSDKCLWHIRWKSKKVMSNNSCKLSCEVFRGRGQNFSCLSFLLFSGLMFVLFWGLLHVKGFSPTSHNYIQILFHRCIYRYILPQYVTPRSAWCCLEILPILKMTVSVLICIEKSSLYSKDTAHLFLIDDANILCQLSFGFASSVFLSLFVCFALCIIGPSKTLGDSFMGRQNPWCLFFFLFLSFKDSVSLCSSGTSCVGQTGLKLRDFACLCFLGPGIKGVHHHCLANSSISYEKKKKVHTSDDKTALSFTNMRNWCLIKHPEVVMAWY